MDHHKDHGGHGSGPASSASLTTNVGFHGMLVLGGQQTTGSARSPVYVSHLPMFMSPHDFQVILRVTGPAADKYGDFVAHFGAFEIYTFSPEKFSIDELDPSTGPLRRSFGGSLFRGHFERGGSDIGENVSLDVEQVVLFRQFDNHGAESTRGDLRYLCFGERNAAFAAHVISAPPDFDQLLAVEVVSLTGISDEDLRGGVIVTVPGRPDALDTRLAETEVCSGVVVTPTTGGHGTVEFAVLREVYLETGDLSRRM